MIKNSNNTKKAKVFTVRGAAALIIAALMAALVFTGCPQTPKPTTPKYKVTFGVEGGNGTIKAEEDGKEINTGTEVEAGKTVTFTATANSGYKFVKWQCNGTDTGVTSTVYTHKVTQDVSITAVFKQDEPTGTGEKIFIEYDADKIMVRTKDKWEKIPSGTEVAAGTWLDFSDKNLPENEVLDKWLVNTKVLDGDNYTVNAADAIVKDGKKVIEVTYTTRPAEQVKIKFDATKIEVQLKGSDGKYHSITTGIPVYEGRWIRFKLLASLPEGEQLDKWKVNAKELNGRGYKLNAADASEEGGQKVIEVTYKTKPGVNPVTLKFDPTLVTVFNLESGNNLKFGDTVYEGDLLFIYDRLSNGTKVDKWFINATEHEEGYIYFVNPADYATENGKKVLRIRFTVKNPPMLTVYFNHVEIECKVVNGAEITPIGPGYKGPAYTYVILKAIVPSGKSIKHWEINGNKIPGSDGATELERQANPNVASGGIINISVVFNE